MSGGRVVMKDRDGSAYYKKRLVKSKADAFGEIKSVHHTHKASISL